MRSHAPPCYRHAPILPHTYRTILRSHAPPCYRHVPNLLHGTADNEDPERTRFSTAWHYVPGDVDLESFPQGGYEDRFTVHSG